MNKGPIIKRNLSIAEKFAKNMEIRMERLGINQSKLSEISGLPRSTIARCYHAKKVPGLETCEVIANALGTSVSNLLNDNNHLLKLTGVPYIDKAIEIIGFNMFKGLSALPKIQHYFDKDYRVYYADMGIHDPQRIGPNLKDELKINYEQPELRGTLPYVRSATIMGMFVVIHMVVRMDKDTDHSIKLPTAVIKDGDSEIVTLISAWRINRKLLIETPEEIKNEKFKIKHKHLQILSVTSRGRSTSDRNN